MQISRCVGLLKSKSASGHSQVGRHALRLVSSLGSALMVDCVHARCANDNSVNRCSFYGWPSFLFCAGPETCTFCWHISKLSVVEFDVHMWLLHPVMWTASLCLLNHIEVAASLARARAFKVHDHCCHAECSFISDWSVTLPTHTSSDQSVSMTSGLHNVYKFLPQSTTSSTSFGFCEGRSILPLMHWASVVSRLALLPLIVWVALHVLDNSRSFSKYRWNFEKIWSKYVCFLSDLAGTGQWGQLAHRQCTRMFVVMHNSVYERATLRCGCADIHALVHQAVTDLTSTLTPPKMTKKGLTAWTKLTTTCYSIQ